MTVHENGRLCGWGPGVRIWKGGDRELHCAEECLHLFQNINLLSREQSLTSDSLYLRKSSKVRLDMRSYWWSFLLCPDETRPTSCRVLIYHDMKLINAPCLSRHLFNWYLAGKASPSSDNFRMKCWLKHDSARRKCVYIVACCLNTDYSSWFTTCPHLVSIFTSP